MTAALKPLGPSLRSVPPNPLILLDTENGPPERACVTFLKLLMPPGKGLRSRHPPSLSSAPRASSPPSPPLSKRQVGGVLPSAEGTGLVQMNPKAFCLSEFLVLFTAVSGVLLVFQGTIEVTVTVVT